MPGSLEPEHGGLGLGRLAQMPGSPSSSNSCHLVLLPTWLVSAAEDRVGAQKTGAARENAARPFTTLCCGRTVASRVEVAGSLDDNQKADLPPVSGRATSSCESLTTSPEERQASRLTFEFVKPVCVEDMERRRVAAAIR